MANNLIISTFPFGSPVTDPKTGVVTWTWMKKFQQWDQQLTNALNIIGQFTGVISQSATISDRDGDVGSTVQHIAPTGVVQPPGIVPATDVAQGGVVLPVGASSNVLGSASLASTTDFDPTGAAATAQANAEAFASDGSNISSGTVAATRLPAVSELSGQITQRQLPSAGITGTATLAKLTVSGTNGSLTFTNGLITGVVNPT